MHPYEHYLQRFHCSSFSELYAKLTRIAFVGMGLCELPFSLSELEHPSENLGCSKINCFAMDCLKIANGDDSDAKAIELIKYLKENPPKVSYENPKLSDVKSSRDEICLTAHILNFGIDLPGSKHNLFGHLQYYTSFFIDAFFGNYTEFMAHVNSLSRKELKLALKKREGYCQFSLVFAPILGLRMVNLDTNVNFTLKEKKEIRLMYSGYNENRHLPILKKLLKLGSDLNDYDINGFNPLHYATLSDDEEMVAVLLKHGANPNTESKDGIRPLSLLRHMSSDSTLIMLDMMLQYKATLTMKDHINDLRTTVETFGSKELAVKVREAMPREKNVCEKCVKPASRLCSACGLVFYCSPACQKMDWKFHKVSCQKKKKTS